MKLLRLLTGVHAGASVRLARPQYLLGRGTEVDLDVADWQQPPLRLSIGADGLVSVSSPDADGDPKREILRDLQPRRFGDVVLCVGPADGAWPSDVALLERLLARKPRKPRKLPSLRPLRPLWARERALLFAGGAMSLMLMAGFVSVLVRGRAVAAPPPEALQSRVVRAIRSAGVTGVTVHTSAKGTVSVDGMVQDGAEATRLRAALIPLGADQVAQRYASAADVARAIADALANPGLSVRYAGDGEFVASGSSIDLESVRGKLQHILTDLGPAVTRIRLAAAELPPPATLPTNALMSSDGLRYVQTRDGTKHLTLTGRPRFDAEYEPPHPNAATAGASAPDH